MAKIGKKIEGTAEGRYNFVEISIRGIPKKELRVVIQQNPQSTWYIYRVTPDGVSTVGWSYNKEMAVRKAEKYIKEIE